jgi:hypothetical protein
MNNNIDKIDFELKEIETYSMNWRTGVMSHIFYINGEKNKEDCQAVPPKSHMYYLIKKLHNKDK